MRHESLHVSHKLRCCRVVETSILQHGTQCRAVKYWCHVM